MSQQDFQRIRQDLVSGNLSEMSLSVRELVTEHAVYCQRVNAIDADLKSLDDQMKHLKVERERLVGVRNYVLDKAVVTKKREDDDAAAKEKAKDEPTKARPLAETSKPQEGGEASLPGLPKEMKIEPEVLGAPN